MPRRSASAPRARWDAVNRERKQQILGLACLRNRWGKTEEWSSVQESELGTVCMDRQRAPTRLQVKMPRAAGAEADEDAGWRQWELERAQAEEIHRRSGSRRA